jgi:hypothetical protein
LTYSFLFSIDANEIGAVEKDSSTLQKEHNELFSAANSRADDPKVCFIHGKFAC